MTTKTKDNKRPSIQEDKRRKSLRDMEVPVNPDVDVDEMIQSRHKTGKGKSSSKANNAAAADLDLENPTPKRVSRANTANTSSSTLKSTTNNKKPHEYHEGDLPMTAGHHTADPFAPREGKALVWRDVNMTLTGTKGEPDRALLKDVWGEVPKKMTTAIMGPSGAGKTSLLNILAGRASSHGRVKISADIRLDNYLVDPTKIEVRRNIAFVAQDDSLQVTSTPRESIYFSAKLRLPRATTHEQLEHLTERMLDELGLVDCADTMVGGALIKGISGGQRKRTSVGVELVTKPALVFLDEPTSGLDSFSAVQLCQVLKKVANAGASVLFTIHQPSSEIFNSFDSLILMNMGRVMYQGPTSSVPGYFGRRGHPNPPHFNPADWIMQVAQSVPIKQLNKDGFFPKDTRALGEAFTTHDSRHDELGITITGHDGGSANDDAPVGMGTQIFMIFRREIRNLTRDKMALGARFGLTIFLALLVGIIFLDVGQADSELPKNLQSQFGAVVMVLMMSMFGTAQPALLAFPEERPVFLREYSTNHYGVLPYFLSRLTMELFITAAQIFVQVVITYFMVGFQGSFGMFYLTTYTLAMASTALAVLLGCAVEDPKLGQELLPILFVPQMLFSGFFVVPELIPVWLRWCQYLCSLTYAVRIIAVEEFDRGSACLACTGFLDNIGAVADDTWWNWIVLAALFCGFRVVALFVLRSKAEKFF